MKSKRLSIWAKINRKKIKKDKKKRISQKSLNQNLREKQKQKGSKNNRIMSSLI